MQFGVGKAKSKVFDFWKGASKIFGIMCKVNLSANSCKSIPPPINQMLVGLTKASSKASSNFYHTEEQSLVCSFQFILSTVLFFPVPLGCASLNCPLAMLKLYHLY